MTKLKTKKEQSTHFGNNAGSVTRADAEIGPAID